MSTEQNRVIVEEGLCGHCAVHVKRVHHRDYPELQAECGTVAEAAAHLAEMLAKDREGARTGWHREAITIAIDEVRAFLESIEEAAQEHRAICRCAPRASNSLEPSIPGRGPSA